MSTINYTENKEYNTAILQINRPDQLNALNSEVISDIASKLDLVEKNQKIRSVIITGAGDKAFVAGADIKEFQNFSQKFQKKIQQFQKIQNFFQKFQKFQNFFQTDKQKKKFYKNFKKNLF